MLVIFFCRERFFWIHGAWGCSNFPVWGQNRRISWSIFIFWQGKISFVKNDVSKWDYPFWKVYHALGWRRNNYQRWVGPGHEDFWVESDWRRSTSKLYIFFLKSALKIMFKFKNYPMLSCSFFYCYFLLMDNPWKKLNFEHLIWFGLIDHSSAKNEVWLSLKRKVFFTWKKVLIVKLKIP